MNIGVVGLGSMGKRRIRLLKKMNYGNKLIGIDNRNNRRQECETLFAIEVEADLQIAIGKHDLDAVIVSTSPLSHGEIINMALRSRCHVFSEINLVADRYIDNMMLAEKYNLVLFLSSTMMYRKEIEYIKERIEQQKVPVNYTYHVGQYLPTWHAWESYKDFFVGDKRTNGCRELFAIEFPWILDVFGNIESEIVMKGRMTTLDINYPDYYVLIVKHENGSVGTINVNVASQKAVRNLEIYGQSLYLKWAGTPGLLAIYNPDTCSMDEINCYNQIETVNNFNDSIIENAYEDELIDFFNAIQKNFEPRYSFEKDSKTLAIIDRIEKEFSYE